ncbi:efflux RND transporter periplasmic adaptor subunit [Kangiella koreensis]|uniref:Efflux transporter, RND family, MFP subunit n=1 Tax=Kangiella koreensis (strain DSM 16069 / JCM 12317 / KCTC 12182 / SW-125) TaxID=523791 RepID=C7RC48_KANKD|nr:HlyD family efflux transporter periplasmic adaptor subunit [Kangiella koreensis]ACV26840.1 efflux transporter, RND family, MFP subunit [Kangiella koreensis DSM 16069]
MGINKRFKLWIVLVAILVALLAYGFWPRAIEVEAVTVTKGQFYEVVSEVGETRVKNIYQVSAPITGYLRRVELEVGDPVEANTTVVAEIEPLRSQPLDPRSEKQAVAELHAAQSALEMTQAKLRQVQNELSFAKSDLERADSLYKDQAISEREYDTAKKIYQSLQQELQATQATLQLRRAELERVQALLDTSLSEFLPKCECSQVLSPADGVVLTRYRESAGVINAAQPIMDVGDPTNLDIKVELISTEAVRVVKGQKVRMKGWGGDTVLEGFVRQVEPMAYKKVTALGIEEQRVNVYIDFTSPQEQWLKLGHGYQLDVDIILADKPNSLIVPVIAMVREGNQWVTFAIEDGVATKRTLQIGAINGLEAEVLSGVSEGEDLIYNPSEEIEDGVSVTPRKR